MVAIAKAYGQIRRGTGPWRTPFLVPLSLLLEPPAHVSIDTGGSAPDLTVEFVPISLDQPHTIRIQLLMKPLPGKVLSNIEIRVVLLKSGGTLAVVESETIEPGDSDYVVLGYRCPSGQTMPPEIRVELTSAVDHIPRPGNPQTLVDLVGVDASTPGSLQPLAVTGGMISGPMVRLAGVRTSINVITGGDYAEAPTTIRGIDLGRIEEPPLASSTPPTSATTFGATATPLGGPETKLNVALRMPTVGDEPATAPAVAALAGGALRPGTYTYKVVYVHRNKNESGVGPASAPITVAANGPRSVRLTALPIPVPLPAGEADDLEVAVTAKRIYRTDPSTSGLSGDDVFVAEVAPGVTTFDDTGPANPAVAPVVRSDLMLVKYTSPMRMHLDGAVQLLDSTGVTRYSGKLRNAPKAATVTYQPGSTPRLTWEADSSTDRVDVGLSDLSTPFGNGVAASITEVPPKFGLHWTILGDEHLEIGATADGSTFLGQIGARLGQPTAPASWPQHEAHVAADLTDPEINDKGEVLHQGNGLIALSSLRSGTLTRGAAAWSQRDATIGRMIVDASFSDTPSAGGPPLDRTLRVRRRSPAPEALRELDLSAHGLEPDVRVELTTIPDGPIHLTTDNRLRWLRALVVAYPTGSTTPITTRAWLDDTTKHLDVHYERPTALIETAWPVRVGATVKMEKLLADGPTTIRADAVVATPATLDIDAQRAELPAPGASGRVAISAGTDLPLSASANPQARVLVHGPTEATTGLRAITARVVGVRGGSYASVVAGFRTDHHPIVDLDPKRVNRSIRAEMYERERRIVPLVPATPLAPLRSAMSVRSADLADHVDAVVAFVQPPGASGRLVGAKLTSSTRWGEGRVWMEPSYPRTAFVAELGADGGIGNITAAFDGIPGAVEFWNLGERAVISGSEVAADKFLPSVGSPGTDWIPGGAFLKLDGSIRLDHVRMATFAADERACRNDDGDDHPVRYSKWAEVLAPFVELSVAGGTGELLIWSASQPNPTPTSAGVEPDPCDPPDPPEELGSALGWSIGPNLTMSMALRQYRMLTFPGLQTGDNLVRWNRTKTDDQEWNDEPVDCGEWELEVDLQMKEYANTVALYPKETTRNPFGDWEAGPGHWRLRQREGLKIPLFLFFGPEIASGDVYMGNVPGGTGPLLPGGIFNYIPPLYAWSYP